MTNTSTKPSSGPARRLFPDITNCRGGMFSRVLPQNKDVFPNFYGGAALEKIVVEGGVPLMPDQVKGAKMPACRSWPPASNRQKRCPGKRPSLDDVRTLSYLLNPWVQRFIAIAAMNEFLSIAASDNFYSSIRPGAPYASFFFDNGPSVGPAGPRTYLPSGRLCYRNQAHRSASKGA